MKSTIVVMGIMLMAMASLVAYLANHKAEIQPRGVVCEELGSEAMRQILRIVNP